MLTVDMYFDEDEVLHIYPSNTIGLMALKQFETSLQTYGLKMLKIHTEMPLHDPFKGTIVM
jgi:hypothetical protein